MEKEKLHPVVIDTFAYYYKKVVSGETGLISDKEIRPVLSEEIEDATRISQYRTAGRDVLKHAVIIKLNGGLGTSMGLTGPKSLLEVKNGKTFLKIMLEQAKRSGVKLAFMNSFNTHQETLAALDRIKPSQYPLCFIQNKFPKVLQDNLAPATFPQNPALEWNPPGHGDIYAAIYSSGTLKTLLDQDIKYAFISNSDNLGAVMDEALLGYFAKNQFPFMMEVAPRTPADLKGGHIARHANGRLILREIAQCPENELHAFKDINRYGFFNTNNIWVNLQYLKNLIESYKMIKLPMIRNPKTLDPRDKLSPGVFQIESAMGAAISLFEGASAIQVPFSRFFPVKKCSDLLAIRSDRFIFAENGNLILNPLLYGHTLQIHLDSQYYDKIDLYEERIGKTSPSLIHCKSLTVEGDVRFENNVIIKGKVTIKNKTDSQAVIDSGSVIEEDIIFD